MHKYFKLTAVRNVIADFADFRKRHFARKHNALCAEPVPCFNRFVIGIVRLGADMNFQLRRGFPAYAERAEVGNEHCVCSKLVYFSEVLLHFCKVTVVRNDVRRDIDLFAHIMREFYPLRHFFMREIVSGSAQRKRLSAYVNRVRPIFQRNFQLIQISGRRQKFRFIHNASFHFFTDIATPSPMGITAVVSIG